MAALPGRPGRGDLMAGKRQDAGGERAANDELETSRPAIEGAVDELAPRLADGAAVLKAAKLVYCGEDEFCLIRKIGPDWLLAETYAQLSPGEPVLVVLGDDLWVAGKASWVGEDRIYVGFDRAIDLDGILASSRLIRNGRQPRMPRVKVDCWARLRVGARVFSVRLSDISQGGARVRVHGLLSAGQQAVLTVRDLPPIAGMIRWRGESDGGISFNQPLGFAELAGWLAFQRQSRPGHGQSTGAHGSDVAFPTGAPALRCLQSA